MKIAANNEQYIESHIEKSPFINKFKIPVLVFFAILVIISLSQSFGLFDYIKLKGMQGPAFRASPVEYIKAIVSETPKSIFNSVDLEELRIDVKFKNWQKLSNYRNIAINNNIISIDEKKYVNASISFRNKRLNAKIRLKGDWTDHLLADKWSFRVKLNDDNYIKGIKKFSLQNPTTRDFQGQLIIDKMLREYNILTPRYFFVNVVINGEDIGIMSFSEHFSKELLESSNRKESVIIKFDEGDLWKSRINLKSYEADQYSAKIIAFGSNRIMKNKKLADDYQVAIGLMRGFLKGELKAHDVFDVKLMGDFLAINDLWGESHGLIWHNLRFYYNPISAKLEPIGFDQMLYHNPDTLDQPKDWISNTKFVSEIRNNGFIKLAYINTLKELRDKLQDKQYLNQYIDLDAHYEALLRSEFFLKPPPLMKNNDLIQRLNLLISKFTESIVHMTADNNIGWAVNPNQTSRVVDMRSTNLTEKSNLFVGEFYKFGLRNLGLDDAFHGYQNKDSKIKLFDVDPILDEHFSPIEIVDLDKFQKIANVFYYDRNGTVFEIQNLIPFSLEIKKILVVFKKDTNLIKKIIDLSNIDKVIPPSKSKVIKLQDINYKDVDKILFSTSLLGGDDNLLLLAESYQGALTVNPISRSTIVNQLSSHKFLKLGAQKIITIMAGSWLVKEPLIVPPGYTLKAGEGVVLKFSENSYILSHGQLNFSGSIDNPIILKSQENNEFWKGITILGNSELPKSELKNVIITDTTSLENNGWKVDAGTFIYQAEVLFDNVKIINNNCEDALNIVNSKYNIKNIVIKDAMFDGLDLDFSNGKIVGGKFIDIGQAGGGDAIDFSGSSSELEGLSISNVYDKGLSIGEKSDIRANNINLSNLNIAVAIKDNSQLKMKNSKISKAAIGVMAYIKKREYKAPLARLNNIEISNTKLNVSSDVDSTIFLDGVLVGREKFKN